MEVLAALLYDETMPVRTHLTKYCSFLWELLGHFLDRYFVLFATLPFLCMLTLLVYRYFCPEADGATYTDEAMASLTLSSALSGMLLFLCSLRQQQLSVHFRLELNQLKKAHSQENMRRAIREEILRYINDARKGKRYLTYSEEEGDPDALCRCNQPATHATTPPPTEEKDLL